MESLGHDLLGIKKQSIMSNYMPNFKRFDRNKPDYVIRINRISEPFTTTDLILAQESFDRKLSTDMCFMDIS